MSDTWCSTARDVGCLAGHVGCRACRLTVTIRERIRKGTGTFDAPEGRPYAPPVAETSPARGRWTFRHVPPTPRSIVELIRAGTLDAELAATLWVLIEGRVPLVVGALPRLAGKTTLLEALLMFLPPGTRTVELAGAMETFDWLPQAPELGWRSTHTPAAIAARVTGRRAAADPSRRHRPAHPGAVRPPALVHLGRRSADRHPGRQHRLRACCDDPRRLAR